MRCNRSLHEPTLVRRYIRLFLSRRRTPQYVVIAAMVQPNIAMVGMSLDILAGASPSNIPDDTVAITTSRQNIDTAMADHAAYRRGRSMWRLALKMSGTTAQNEMKYRTKGTKSRWREIEKIADASTNASNSRKMTPHNVAATAPSIDFG